MRQKSKFSFNKKIGLTMLLVAFLILILPSVWRLQKQQSRVEEEINNLKKEIAEYEGKNNDIKKLVTYLESDAFLEEQARLNFNLKKPGEKVVIIEDGNDINSFSVASSTKNSSTEETPNYKLWLDYFFNPKN